MRYLPVKINKGHKAQEHRSTSKRLVTCVLVTCVLICSSALFSICYSAEPPRYDIDASLDVSAHKIAAKQTVTFTNNSDKPLEQIYFHIYPHRRYTQKEIRFMYRYAGYFKVNPFPEGFQGGDLKVTSISSSGAGLTYAIEGNDQTILRVNLDSPLEAGGARELKIDFSVDIPHSFGRFGWHNNIVTLVRWYPILSAYDERGWHNYPFYIYHQPYFSDSSFYNVKLTLASGLTVASTGLLKGEVVNNDGTKTIQIETDFPVRDFSLGISPDFLLYTLADGKMKINSFYLKGDETSAKQAAEFALGLMKFYAQNFGEYPYAQFNIVPSYLGYGGCQSSNQIFIDRRVYKLPQLLNRYFDFLIAHETGHQWFYNMIGSDEYKEMFLDEGMNSYWLLRYLEDKYGPEAKVYVLPKVLRWFIPDFSFYDASFSRYIFLAKNGYDRPIISDLSSFQEPSSIFAITYGKGAGVLEMLKARIGEEKFLKIVRRYTKEFRFGNISLEQFIRLANEESEEDLGEYFKQWLKTRKQADYAVKHVSRGSVVLENRGRLKMPVDLRIIYDDNTEEKQVWDGQGTNKVFFLPQGKKVKSVELGPPQSLALDVDLTNNYWPRKLNIKAVPLYFFVYEMPVLLPRNSYNLVVGPSVGGSSLGLASSWQKPYDDIFRFLSEYDFNDEAVKSKIGYERQHVLNKQIAAGIEVFHHEYSHDKEALTGGKVYLRRELWPASYGLFDVNDQVTFYLLRDQKLNKTSSGLSGSEDVRNLYYRKKDEAIFGIAGSFGRYGPYPDPDYGFRIVPIQEFAGHFLGGDETFWRTSLEWDKYQLLVPKHQHKLAARVRLGWGEGSDKRLFQLGGPDALRGFDRKTIEGAHMFLTAVEYRLPLKSQTKLYFLDNMFCLDKIQAVGFFDLGKAWYSDFSDSDFKKDAGLGLRLHFDILGFVERAILRIDVARAINAPKEDTHLWLGMSHSF